jgi:hypothetical protein
VLGGVVERIPILLKHMRVLGREEQEARVYTRLRKPGLGLSPVFHDVPESIVIRDPIEATRQ